LNTFSQPVIVEESKNHADVNGPETEIKTCIEDIQVNALNSVFERITCSAAGVAQKYLYPDYDHIKGGGNQEQQLVLGA